MMYRLLENTWVNLNHIICIEFKKESAEIMFANDYSLSVPRYVALELLSGGFHVDARGDFN